ncbi:Mrp/NBP35 family ATP-binding protein [Hydrogenimonas thermophila]|uniref:Mrp/NBP35 family ATP-binding protein n=1 Tax=Hydrogenimonas thermophila TaxID=223786 RepID=UPI0029373225|nr:Mrp/NBP35 family ATP-binding protein [Hydrogenimonas thermophila]WOE70015.1 Mrp/NBP35 family ATP-binding protein [Hydrogenimonas thermophila]WOE72532.1 Mrp/NBP35 family ATP-binding protein [Hydrogenimonas thermophila]
MSREKILNELQKVQYPGLDKSIIDLKIVEDVKVDNEKPVITLSMQNDEAYNILESRLNDLFNGDVEVKRKALTQKKSMNYGNTANPNNRAPYAKRVIAVTSGKGGVGKSTVSVNLSVALAQKGFKVGLLDADVYGPNVPRMTQVADEKLKWNDNNKIVPSENFGIKIMSVGLTTPSSDTPLVWRSSVAVSALIQFLEDVDWGELDFLVIDMPPGTGDIQLTMAQELPITAGVIVTTPQPVALDDVSRAIMMFKDINVPIRGLVENMSFFIAPDTKKRYDIFGKGGGEDTAKRYDIPFLGKIPLDMQIREFSDNGTPPVAMGDKLQKGYYKNIVDNLLKQIL